MNFTKILIGTAAVLSLAACSKSKDNTMGSAAVSAPALEDTSTYNAGTPNFIFNIESGVLSVDGVAIEKIDNNTFAGFPMLASQVADLSSVNRVVETKENSLELWNRDSLLVAFDLRSGSPSLLHSHSGKFTVESASWAMDASGQGQGKGLNHAILKINMRECAGENKQQQGKQAQEQGKKSLLADVDVGGQGQGQEQGKKEEKPAENCKLVSFTYHLAEVAQPKEQEQGKPGKQGQEQGQEQGEEQEKKF